MLRRLRPVRRLASAVRLVALTALLLALLLPLLPAPGLRAAVAAAVGWSVGSGVAEASAVGAGVGSSGAGVASGSAVAGGASGVATWAPTVRSPGAGRSGRSNPRSRAVRATRRTAGARRLKSRGLPSISVPSPSPAPPRGHTGAPWLPREHAPPARSSRRGAYL